MAEANSEAKNATRNVQQQGQRQEQEQRQQPVVSFDLPEEPTQTALESKDRITVIDLQTGKEVLEPVAQPEDKGNLILVCLDPSKKPDRLQVSLLLCCGSSGPVLMQRGLHYRQPSEWRSRSPRPEIR